MVKKQVKEVVEKVIEEIKPEVKKKVKKVCSPQLLEQLKNMRELARIKRLEIGDITRKATAVKELKKELNKQQAEELENIVKTTIKKEEIKQEVKPKKKVIKKIIKYEDYDDDEEDNEDDDEVEEIEYIRQPSKAKTQARPRIESKQVEQPTPRDVDLLHQSANDRLRNKIILNNKNNYMDIMNMNRY